MLTDIFDACSELRSNGNVVPPTCASHLAGPLGWSMTVFLHRGTLYRHEQLPLVNGNRMSVHMKYPFVDRHHKLHLNCSVPMADSTSTHHPRPPLTTQPVDLVLWAR